MHSTEPWDEHVARAALGATRRHHRLDADATLLRIGLTAVFTNGCQAVKVCAPGHRSVAELEDEHRLLAHLARHGVRVPPPGDVWATDDGLVLAASEYLTTDGTAVRWEAFGELLAQVHATTPPAWLTQRFAGRDVAADRLARLRHNETLTADDHALLADLLPGADEIATARVSDDVLVHGDAHEGNVVVSGGQLWLLDWERAAVGARQVDMSSFVQARRRHGLSGADLAAVWRGYGAAFDDDLLCAALCRCRDVSGVCYLLLSAGAPQRAEGQARLADLRNRRTDRIWPHV